MKKFLAYLLTVAMTAGVAISGTMAYLTSEDSDVNVMTLGNVKIEQHEYERVVEDGDFVLVDTSEVDPNYGYNQAYKLREFTQAKPAYPAVYTNGTTAWDEFQQLWNQVGAPGSNDLFDDSMKNVIDKFVFVENTGKSDAYYRTIIAIEAPEGITDDTIHTSFNANSRFDYNDEKDGVQNAADSNKFYAEINGVQYLIYVATYTEVLKPGEVSRPSLLQVFLDPAATNEDCALFGDTWEILTLSQAVQTKGFTDAQTALDTAFGDITPTSHPWLGTIVADKLGITEAGTYNLEGDVYSIDNGYFHTQEVEGDVTINGNGATVNGIATSADSFTWEGGTIPAMSAIFSSTNGSTVTVNDLSFTGTMSAIMMGHYKNATYNNYNTVFNNVDVIGTEVVSFSQNISPAVCAYGTATINNCNIYGTTLSELDTDPRWPVYDMAAVNYTDVTINNSKIGSIYMWNQAKVTVAAGSEVDKIVVRGNMNATKYGLTIKAGATVDNIDLSNITDKAKVNITIEDGATVKKVIANGVTYASIVEWQNNVSSVGDMNVALQNGGLITLNADVTLTDVNGLTFTKDTELNLNGYNIIATGDAIVVTDGTLIIKGEGSVVAGDGSASCAVWANGGNVEIYGGSYAGSSDADGIGNDTIYTKNGGTVAIYGGTYSAKVNDQSYAKKQWTCLNENDSTGGDITVYGGTFINFNPNNNVSESDKTSFLADGFTVKSEVPVNQPNGKNYTYYTVVEDN